MKGGLSAAVVLLLSRFDDDSFRRKVIDKFRNGRYAHAEFFGHLRDRGASVVDKVAEYSFLLKTSFTVSADFFD